MQFVLDTVTATLGPVGNNQVRPLAVSLGQRAGSLPQIPTFTEAGVALEADAWNAVFAPAGTPPEAIRALNAAMNTAISDPAMREGFVRSGAEPIGGTPDDLAAKVRRDRGKWGPITQALGLRAQ